MQPAPHAPDALAATRALSLNQRLRACVAARLRAVEAALSAVDSVRHALGRSHDRLGARRRPGKRVRRAAFDASSVADAFAATAHDVDGGNTAVVRLITGAHRGPSRWGTGATSVLLDALRPYANPCAVPYEDAVWQRTACAMQRRGFLWCTRLECYRHAQATLADRDTFTPQEDALLCQRVTVHGRDWHRVAQDVYAKLGRRRSVWQLAQRYRDVMRVTFIERRLSPAAVWARVRRWVDAGEDDAVRVTLLANADGELALHPRSVRHAMEHARLHRLGNAALYWKVVALLNRAGVDYPERLEYLAERVVLCHEQLTLPELARQLRSTEDTLRARIVARLLKTRRTMHLVDFERLSVELFGHARCSRVIFDEARRLCKQDVLAASPAGGRLWCGRPCLLPQALAP